MSSLGEPGLVKLLVRLPAGGAEARRFRRDAPLRMLFEWVEAGAALAAGVDPGGYALRMTYPPRALSPPTGGDDARTLADAGLTGRQEALFLQVMVGRTRWLYTDRKE